MIRSTTLLILAMFFFSLSVIAQEKTIAGKVISAEDGLGLPNVSVVIKNTSRGTVSDLDGNYIFEKVSPNDTLLFRYVGFISKEVKVGSNKIINIEMNPESQELEEVVITALGVKRQKREVGYLTQKLDGDIIIRSGTPNIITAIAGRAAGVQVSTGDGVDGGSTRITIRGNNNFNSNNQPLIVVDGIPMDNVPGLDDVGRGVDWGNALNNLNAFDIEDQTILSGGQASALYGSRGANGVIEIRTKRGSKRKGLGIQYNLTHKIIQPYRFREVQNIYGHGGPVSLSGPSFPTSEATGDTLLYPKINTDNLILNQDGETSSTSEQFGYYGGGVSWGPEMNGQLIKWWDGEMRAYSPQPDNYKSVFKTGYTTTHNIAAAGGNEKGTMRVSITRKDHTPIIDNSNYNQTTINLASNLKLSDRISADVSVNYINFNRLNSPVLGESANSFSKGFLYSWGRSYKGLDQENYALENGARNPQDGYPFLYVDPYLWWNYNNNNTQQTRDKYLGSITLNYEITNWLNLMARAGRDFSLTQFETRNQPTDALGLQGGYYENSLNRNISNIMDFMLSAERKNILGSNIHMNLTVGGSSWQSHEYYLMGHSGTWYYPHMYTLFNYTESTYSTDDFGNLIVDQQGDNPGDIAPAEYLLRRKTNSVYSFLNLAYKNIVFLDLTGRNDWSSTLPQENNSYFYPSLSLSFIASEAFDFKSSLPWINFLKIRGGAAQSATDGDPYQTEFYYTTDFFGADQASYFPSTIPPINLKPQRVNAYEGGINISFLENAIDLDFTYYYIYSFDQILDQLPIPGSSGANSLSTNKGAMSNKGIEVVLTTVPIHTQHVTLRSGINFSRNKNIIESLGEDVTVFPLADIWGLNGPAMILREGDDYGTISGYDYVYHENGQPIVSDDGTHYLITDTRVPIGNASPDFLAGWSTQLTFKGFTLSTLVDTKWGGDIYCGSYVIGLQTGQSPETLIERQGGGLPYTDPDGNTSNIGVILEGVYEDGTSNDKVVHYYYKYMPNAGGWGKIISTPGIVENTWIKMREIALSYSFNPTLVSKSGIFQKLTLSIVGRDLFYFYTTLPDKINPEGVMGAGNAQGFEWASFPGTRSFIMSINASF